MGHWLEKNVEDANRKKIEKKVANANHALFICCSLLLLSVFLSYARRLLTAYLLVESRVGCDRTCRRTKLVVIVGRKCTLYTVKAIERDDNKYHPVFVVVFVRYWKRTIRWHASTSLWDIFVQIRPSQGSLSFQYSVTPTQNVESTWLFCSSNSTQVLPYLIESCMAKRFLCSKQLDHIRIHELETIYWWCK
jgi:hypothetical protein